MEAHCVLCEIRSESLHTTLRAEIHKCIILPSIMIMIQYLHVSAFYSKKCGNSNTITYTLDVSGSNNSQVIGYYFNRISWLYSLSEFY
jgi:hypothetical protein